MDIKVYHDPHYKPGDPIVMGYKGITNWSEKVNTDTKATLDALDYDTLTDEEKGEYARLRGYIHKWETTGKDPIGDAGFFYCPYIPDDLRNDPAITVLPEEMQAYEDLKTMAGVQPLKNGWFSGDYKENANKFKTSLAFMMRTKYILEGSYLPKRELNVVLAPPNPPSAFSEMAITIDRVVVTLDKIRSIKEWRIAAARQLLLHSDYSYLWDTHRQHVFDSDVTDYQKPFIVRQNRSHVAKKCRRGAGNVIVGSKQGIKALALFNRPDEEKFTKQQYRIVEFEEDEVAAGPFAVIGYAGHSPYDHALSLSLIERDSILKRGGFGTHEHPHAAIDRYWNRLI